MSLFSASKEADYNQRLLRGVRVTASRNQDVCSTLYKQLSLFEKNAFDSMIKIEGQLSNRHQEKQKKTSLLTQGEKKVLEDAINAQVSNGLPSKIANIWREVTPLIIEAAYCITEPAASLKSNVKTVRRVYGEMRRLTPGLKELHINNNIMECLAAAIGVVPHFKSQDLVEDLINNRRSSFNLPTGAFARSEAFYCLEIIMSNIWMKRFKEALGTEQIIIDTVEAMGFLYWKASRSELFDSIVIDNLNVDHIERKEREIYYEIFDSETNDDFISYVKNQVMAMHSMRVSCARRYSRFLLRDQRLSYSRNDYFNLIDSKYSKNKSEDECDIPEETALETSSIEQEN